jgi:hypothetical protein
MTISKEKGTDGVVCGLEEQVQPEDTLLPVHLQKSADDLHYHTICDATIAAMDS